MKRRDFIRLLAGATAAWPLAARAQAERMKRIGVLMPYLPDDLEAQARMAAFRHELSRLGWTAEKAFFEERWVSPDEASGIRAEAFALVASQPDIIVVNSPRALAPLQQATKAIPIVFVGISDPVGAGFVQTLAQPGGNSTGFALIEFSVIGKSLELLRQVAPSARRIAMVSNHINPSTVLYSRAFKSAAEALSLEYLLAPVRDAASIESVIESVASTPDSGLLVPPDVTVQSHRELVVRLTKRYRLPAIYSNRMIAVSGGLMSYGTDVTDQFRRAASYVDRILRGERPAELPVQQPTRFELVVNLKAAKALGLEIPPAVLARADEVIE